jgi:hypothetical protein
VRERRDLGEQRRLDVLARDQDLDRLDPGGERRIDEIFTLGEEEPELVAPAALVELPNELELVVLA